MNSTDPVDELKWLIFELQSSELAHENVHIVGHIPLGHSDCVATSSRKYFTELCPDFQSTIAAQFFGHTHFEELEFFYPKDDSFRASSVAYVGPSKTSYFNLNPGYRIYYVDGDYKGTSRTVVDHETWVTDLGEANRLRSPKLTWYKLYSAREAYGMTSLSPTSWDDMVISMYKNRRLFNLYYRFYNKNLPVAPDYDDECMKSLLCDARSGRSHAREDTCRIRPTNFRSPREGLTGPNNLIVPQSRMAMIFGRISSAISAFIGFFTFPLGFG